MNISHKRFLLVCLLFVLKLPAQTLTSVVVDSATQKPIPYVTVLINNKGMITNEEGRFTFLIDGIKETDSLFISCIGYETIGKPLNQFTEETVILRPKAIELKNVIVSNKQYSAEEIIDLVKENLEKNYSANMTKKRLFFRNSSFQRMNQLNYALKKSTIEAFNKKFIDSVIRTVPKSNSYYTEVLGDLYGNYEEENQKLALIKASELYDKSMELDFEKLEEKFNTIIKENVRTDSYFKIKSGLFGTKIDADEIFENEVDSTDVAALNKTLEEKKKNEEERKKNFAKYRRNTLGDILKDLPIQEDTDLNFLTKSNKYEFTLQDFTYLGEDAVYVVNFKPKRSADYKGQLFINSDDFALIRADYENVKSLRDFSLLGISINEYLLKGKIIFSKGAENLYHLRYFESEKGSRIGVKRPLKIIEMNKIVKGRNKQNELSGKIDLLMSNIEKNEVVVFETENIGTPIFEAFKENNTVLPVYMPNYDPEFWKGYNIIEPNTAIREFTSEGEGQQ
ncbi:MAG: carboxypeptidase-like regulatory domain-containing protein [Flavobacteriaceae bacterium]